MIAISFIYKALKIKKLNQLPSKLKSTNIHNFNTSLLMNKRFKFSLGFLLLLQLLDLPQH